LELGCGVGHGVLWLLGKGFEVVANDMEPEALDIVRSRVPAEAHVEFLPGRFEDITMPEADLIVAGFSLFFLPPSEFADFWPKVVRALRPGGVFAGQFLGVHDDWAARGYTVMERSQVERMLQGLEVLALDEADQDGETSLGEAKHWHVFHVVARKPTGVEI
jgi:tellurite methyltransferase